MNKSTLNRLRYLILISVIFNILQIEAQKVGLPEIEYFNRRQYGGGTQNWKITQNENDLIYFANNEGILEFDGVNWKIYNESISSVVRSIMADNERIYAGYFNQLGYFQYNDSSNHLDYHPFHLANNLQKSGDFWNIHKWNDKVVFQATDNVLIFKDDKLISTIPTRSRFSSSYKINGLLLVHDESEGLLEIRGEKAYKVPNGSLFSNKLITTMIPLSEDKILIGTMKNGLYLWDMNRITPWQVEGNDLLKKFNVFCGTRYRNEYLVFGTIQSGFLILNNKGEVVMHVDKDKGLKNNTVLSCFVDREGNIWGGLDNGIVRLSFNSSVTFLQGYYDIGTGYLMDKIGNDYYMGTNQGLFKITERDLHNPLKTRNDFHKIKGSDGQVWSLYHNGSLLCGHNLGVFELENKEFSLITPSHIKGAWLFRKVPEHPELLIVGTYNGLILLEKKSNKWQFKTVVEGFHESSRFVEWDDEGYLWIAHGYEGLFRLQFNESYEKVINVHKYAFNDVYPGSDDFIVSTVEGECVFIGNNGLFKWSQAKNDFERYNKWDQYFEEGDFPKKLYYDQFKNLWYFYYGKVGVLRRLEDGSYRKVDFPFKVLNGKFVNSFETVAVFNENETFFCVEDGFAHYYQDEDRNYRSPFKLSITSFKGGNDTLSYVISQTDDTNMRQSVIPEYSFKNNSFTIQYAAVYFSDDDVEYSTCLKNYDDGFSPWSDRKMREFAKLKEGDYEFIVKARNRYEVQSSPISIKFTVLPPWYRSVYAGVGYVFLLIIFTYLVFLVFNKRLEVSKKNEQLKQKALYKEKEETLTREALRAEKEMIKMRNEKLRNEMTHKEKELANTTMNIIRKNEFLSALKLQLKKLKTVSDRGEMENKIMGLIKRIDKDLDSESYWEVFEMHLEQVHDDFLTRLKELHPDLTQREHKLSAYIRMGMASKEIASLMNISARAVENNRYKLRQKMNISQGQNLSKYITSL